MAHWSNELCDPLMRLSLIGATAATALGAYASIINKQPEGEVNVLS